MSSKKRDRIINDYKDIKIFRSTTTDRSCAYPNGNFIRYASWQYDDPSDENLFSLLHEIGHIINDTDDMLVCEKEFYATQWAIEKSSKYKISISNERKEEYQNYIWKCRKRANRTKKQLTLQW